MGMNPGGRHRAEINVTPMIDVLLVVLISFMVVNSHTVGVDARAPETSKGQSEANPQDIVLMVHGNATVSLNQEVVADADLEARLTKVFATRGNHVIFISAEPDLDFQQVIHVIDVARGVGLNRIAMLPRQPSNL
jgi:biopolymer transport protein ExbD/biopolymer transport protein TolR